MRLAIRALSVYLRILVALLVVGAIGLILFKNRSYEVNVWLFGLTDATRPVNVVWVMLATAACTLTAWWVISLSRGLVRDYRQMRREQEQARSQQLTRQKMEELDSRQRHIEEQLGKPVQELPPGQSEIEL